MQVWAPQFLVASKRFCKVCKSGGPNSELLLKGVAGYVPHFLFILRGFARYVSLWAPPTYYLFLNGLVRYVSRGSHFLFACASFSRVCKSGAPLPSCFLEVLQVCKSGGPTSYLVLEGFAGYVSLGAPLPSCF
jgi:hypothetical protein